MHHKKKKKELGHLKDYLVLLKILKMDYWGFFFTCYECVQNNWLDA